MGKVRGGIKGTGARGDERGQSLGCGGEMKGVGEGQRGYKGHWGMRNERGQSLERGYKGHRGHEK